MRWAIKVLDLGSMSFAGYLALPAAPKMSQNISLSRREEGLCSCRQRKEASTITGPRNLDITFLFASFLSLHSLLEMQ